MLVSIVVLPLPRNIHSKTLQWMNETVIMLNPMYTNIFLYIYTYDKVLIYTLGTVKVTIITNNKIE